MENSGVSRSRRLASNALFSWLSWFFPLLLSFFATPVIVKGLGPAEYGLYALIIGFIGYTFGFGIGRTSAKYVAEYRASGQSEKISEVVSAALWFSLAIGSAGALTAALLAGPIADDVLNIVPDSRSAAITALYIAGATVLIYAVSQIFQSVLQGLNRFDRYSVLTNVNGILLQAGNIAIVVAGYGMLELLYWNLFVVTAMCLAFYINARSLLPELKLKFSVGRESFAAVLGYGTSIIIYQICGNIMIVFERAWIVRKLGSEALAFYVVPMTLALYMQGIIGSLAIALFPSFNELLNDRDKLIRLYQKATKMILAIIVFISLSLIVTGRDFLMVWINSQFSDSSYSVLVIHTLTFAIIALFTIMWQLAEAKHSASYNAAIAFVWMAAAVVLGVLLIEDWRNEGVAAARLVGVVLTLPLIPLLERRFLGRAQLRFWAAILFRILISAAVAVIVQVLLLQQLSANWLTLFLTIAAGGPVYALGLWVTGFVTADERAMFAQIVRNRR